MSMNWGDLAGLDIKDSKIHSVVASLLRKYADFNRFLRISLPVLKWGTVLRRNYFLNIWLERVQCCLAAVHERNEFPYLFPIFRAIWRTLVIAESTRCSYTRNPFFPSKSRAARPCDIIMGRLSLITAPIETVSCKPRDSVLWSRKSHISKDLSQEWPNWYEAQHSEDP